MVGDAGNNSCVPNGMHWTINCYKVNIQACCLYKHVLAKFGLLVCSYSALESMRMEALTITATLRWLSGTRVNRAIIVADFESVLCKSKIAIYGMQWAPCIDSSYLHGLV